MDLAERVGLKSLGGLRWLLVTETQTGARLHRLSAGRRNPNLSSIPPQSISLRLESSLNLSKHTIGACSALSV